MFGFINSSIFYNKMRSDIRILVEGSRGKSGLVIALTNILYERGEDSVGKITGKETVVFRNGQKLVVERKDGKNTLIDRENEKIINDYRNVRFKIFENQALSCYTMRVVHLVVNPQIVVIPNIRFEHQDKLGDDLYEIARSFAHNFKGVKKVITTENKKEVINIFDKYCSKYNVKLVVIGGSNEDIPSISSIELIDRVLKEVKVGGLSKKEKNNLRNDIKKAMGLRYSKFYDIWYFNGAKVNDIESSTNVFNYLKKMYPSKKFVFLCYLRDDRPERTESFIPFFDNLFKDNLVKRVYFTGSGLSHVKNSFKSVKDKKLTQKEVIDFCKKNKLVLFTAVNGVNEFIQKLEVMLED